MKDEIKEIIDNLEDVGFMYKRISPEEIKKILDTINNLQEENETLKNGYCELKVKCNNGECDCTNEEYDEMVESNIKLCNDLDDYKSRCEKAGEMIRFIAFNSERPLTMTELNKVYYILKGSDKDE